VGLDAQPSQTIDRGREFEGADRGEVVAGEVGEALLLNVLEERVAEAGKRSLAIEQSGFLGMREEGADGAGLGGVEELRDEREVDLLLAKGEGTGVVCLDHGASGAVGSSSAA